MSVLEHIPFFDLHGGAFLLVHAIFVAAVLLVAHLAFNASDPTSAASPPPVPSAPDAFEIAYLVGGVNQVIRTVVYDLYRRGCVEVHRDKMISAVPERLEDVSSTPIERNVLDVLRRKSHPSRLFGSAALRAATERFCAPLRARLDAQALILPRSAKRRSWGIFFVALGVIVGVAILKSSLALSQGRSNIGFLVALAVVGSILLLLRAKRGTSDLSRRGRAYVEQLRRAFAGAKSETIARLKEQPAHAVAYEGASLFLVGLFGYELLRGGMADPADAA